MQNATAYAKHLQQTRWPVVVRFANGDVFDKSVAPRLQQSGVKIAYLMVMHSAMSWMWRLRSSCYENGKVELKPALSQLRAFQLADQSPCEPKTLTRVARYFLESEPVSALGAALEAFRWLNEGRVTR